MRILFLGLYIRQHLETSLLAVILPSIWLACLGLLLFGSSWRVAANFFMAALIIVIWANIFFVQAGIHAVVIQYCLLAVSCGYYLLGPERGLICSLVSILPLVAEVVLRNYFGYEIPGRDILPNLIGYPILIISNFLLLVYIHFMFFDAHMRLDQQKDLLQNELVAALAESRSQTIGKTNFLLTMSHQLRTPLNVVQGTANLLMSGEKLPRQDEYLQILRFSINNLMSSINHIVDFTNLEEGGVELAHEPFFPGDLINRVYQSFMEAANRKNFAYSLDSDHVLRDVRVYGDAGLLSQILFHLVENAIKFTETGHIAISVNATKATGDNLQLSFKVEDTGIGLSKEQLHKVLDPFASNQAASSRQHHGTLGLAIADRLVRLHGHSLVVESREGYGTTISFNIIYPLEIKADVKGSASPGEQNLVGYRVLIADDEPLNILVIRRQLERLGIDVESCVDGVQAVEKVAAGHYDLVLMDINMPRMDGFEAAKRIRQLNDPSKAVIPIVAVTASTEAVETGVDQSPYINDYMLKPFSVEDLRSKIRLFLTK